MRFRPASWSAEPSFFTIEGDAVAFCTAVWQVHDRHVTEMLRAFGDLDPDETVEIDITVSRDSLLRNAPSSRLAPLSSMPPRSIDPLPRRSPR